MLLRVILDPILLLPPLPASAVVTMIVVVAVSMVVVAVTMVVVAVVVTARALFAAVAKLKEVASPWE